MAKTVDPGALENLYPENAFKAALLKRTRAQRIPFRPGVRYSNKGRIHSRRPILSSHFSLAKRRRTIHFESPTIGPQLQGAYSFCGRIATLSGFFRSDVGLPG